MSDFNEFIKTTNSMESLFSSETKTNQSYIDEAERYKKMAVGLYNDTVKLRRELNEVQQKLDDIQKAATKKWQPDESGFLITSKGFIDITNTDLSHPSAAAFGMVYPTWETGKNALKPMRVQHRLLRYIAGRWPEIVQPTSYSEMKNRGIEWWTIFENDDGWKPRDYLAFYPGRILVYTKAQALELCEMLNNGQLEL